MTMIPWDHPDADPVGDCIRMGRRNITVTITREMAEKISASTYHACRWGKTSDGRDELRVLMGYDQHGNPVIDVFEVEP